MGNKFTKQEKSWILYDWANSSFATIMMAAIFPIYFSSVMGDGGGDMWLGVGASVATAVSAVLAPILGAFGDYKGYKKKLFVFFLILGLVTTAMCAVVDMWQLLLVGYALSNIGFSGSTLFYDSMLTDITTPQRMNKVSAWGFSMGYIGGSTIPFIISILIITFGGAVGIDSALATKISIMLCVVWWGLFSIPILRDFKQSYGKEKPQGDIIKPAFVSLKGTIIEIFGNKGLTLFIIAYFFYIDGVGTVIKMSTAYGESLGLDSVGMILALLVTQFVAFPCAILFSKLAYRFGTLNIIMLAIVIYFFICILGFVMGYGIEEAFLTQSQALIIFWGLAIMVGTAQGGIQALSRSYFGAIIPKERSNEYFGFYDIFGRFAAVMGPAVYSVTKSVTGRSSISIFSIIIFFAVGGILLMLAKKHLPPEQGDKA